jgi:hypothetical protein
LNAHLNAEVHRLRYAPRCRRSECLDQPLRA